MYKTTFQKIAIAINRSLTNLFSSRDVFGKLFLTFLVFLFSANGIPDWQGNKNKSLEDWTWEIVKENEDVQFPFTSHWTKRAGLQALNLNGNFYIFGGRTPLPLPIPGASILHGDVWSSSDKGKTWEQILESNPPTEIPDVGIIPSDPNLTEHWANRAYFQAVKKGSYMYIIGGQDFSLVDKCFFLPPNIPCDSEIIPFSQFFNDVWRSRDGINWKQMIQNQAIDLEDDNPPHWAGRAGLSATVFKGYIYVMGGSVNDDVAVIGGPPAREYFNDVWRSRDGRSWERVKKNQEILPGDETHWAQRAGGIAVVKGGYMYMVGGEEGFTCTPIDSENPWSGFEEPCPPYFNDVWRTKDGVNWKRMIDNQDVDLDNPTHWSKRPGHQVVVAQNQLVLFGGFGLGENKLGNEPSNPSDVWVSNDGSKWEKVSDAPWNADGSEDIKYDFDAVVEKGYGKFSDAIYTFGGDRETFDFTDDENYLNVDNDVWKFSLPKKEVEEDTEKTVLALQPNYPNPFRGSTTLKYSIPNRSYVSIKVYDKHGRFVSTLVAKTQNEGEYETNWNGRNHKNKQVRKGLYFATLWSKGKAKTVKMYKK